MCSLKKQLTEKITKLNGASQTTFEGKKGLFVSFLFKEKEFAHFHGETIIDLRLTKKTIANEDLKHSKASTNHPTRSPNSPWIELEFTNQQQMQSVFAYVKKVLTQMN